MPPFVVPNDPVPTVPPPIGALLTFASPDGGADVFGTLDVRVTMTGLPTCERLELYLDDAKQDEAMSKIGRNRYIQTVQTSFCADGRHRFAVVARDAQKKIIATSARDVFFRNVGNIHVMSALPTPADDGYEIALRVNALRVRLGPESFALADWVRGILQDEYGVDLNKLTWLCWDDPHLAEFANPGGQPDFINEPGKPRMIAAQPVADRKRQISGGNRAAPGNRSGSE